MFVLDVVISLVFIYLLYSLLATIIQELLANWFSFRSKMLEQAIFRMLEDESTLGKRFSSWWGLFKKSDKNASSGSTTSGLFYDHPLVKFLSEDQDKSKPSYLNKETFSKVMIDLLRGDDLKLGDSIKPLIQKSLDAGKMALNEIPIGPETLKYLNSIWIDAQGDIDVFRKSLENWFDQTMERCTGWYIRHVKSVLLIIGLFIAIIFNVDTIAIVEKLHSNPKLTEAIVQQANAFVANHANLYDERINDLKDNRNDFNSLSVSNKKDTITLQESDKLAREKNDALIKRGSDLVDRADALIKQDIANINGLMGMGIGSFSWNGWLKFFSIILGWLITALALSLGAPFWFDLLNKLMKLRSSINIPTASQTQKKD